MILESHYTVDAQMLLNFCRITGFLDIGAFYINLCALLFF